MPATISESYLSRPFEVGLTQGRELIYDIIGTEDETEVLNLLASESPGLYLGLFRQTLSADPIGGGVWKGYVRYAGLEGEPEYTFDTGGGTAKLTQSLGTIASYAPPGLTAPNFQGAIGVTEDRVEGVDIVIPSYEFTETHYFFDHQVTGADRLLLRNMTGRINDAPFREHEAGECLFLGATGAKRGFERWAITFRFAASENVEDLPVGPITVASKLGWDYMWVRYADFEDETAYALVKRPVAAYVERVYQLGNFADLGIGTV